MNFSSSNRSQIKQTLKKKAFEEAGIPVKQISMVQVQSPAVAPTLIAPAATTVSVSPTAQVTHQIDGGTVYIKTESQIITSSMPSTSTALIIPAAAAEPPNELIVSEIKEEEIQINDEEVLISSMDVPPVEGTDDSIESAEIKIDEVTSG